MATTPVKLAKDFGPPRLRKVHQDIVALINKIRPIEGIGISVSEQPDGSRIELSDSTNPDGSKDTTRRGGGGGGTGGDLYGALNGQPAIFHFSATAPPTAIPDE